MSGTRGLTFRQRRRCSGGPAVQPRPGVSTGSLDRRPARRPACLTRTDAAVPETAAVVSLFNPDDGVLANAAALLLSGLTPWWWSTTGAPGTPQGSCRAGGDGLQK